MTPEQAKLQQQLRPLVLKTLDTEAPYEMTKAFLRYEVVRCLSPNAFTALCHRNITEGIPFDTMVDELVLAATKPA